VVVGNGILLVDVTWFYFGCIDFKVFHVTKENPVKARPLFCTWSAYFL